MRPMTLLDSRAATSAVTTRKASPHDAPVLARALAAAFYDDPVGSWFLPDPRTRARRLEKFFRLVSIEKVALPHGEVVMSDDGAGAALWMPPQAMETGALAELLLMPRLVRASGGAIRRVLRGLAAMDKVHPHEPHWYLPQLGVLPSRQGEGIGSALVRPVLERCDREGSAAYLEATTQRNRALYLRHGFEDHGVMRLPDDGPPLWRMWREPRA